MQRDWYKKLVRAHYPLSDETHRLISAATYDLYHGPFAVGESIDDWTYPGFESACDAIKAATDHVGELWADYDSDCISETEPQGEEIEGEWCEPSGEWYHLDRKTVIGALVGDELAKYL